VGLGLVGGGYAARAWRRQPDLLQRALAHGPRVVMLSFGEINELAAPLRARARC